MQPGPGPGEWWKGGGGASPWDPIVYDPALDLIYVGTGNPSPWYPELRGTVVGDNLYSSSIVALNARTGDIVWHYQTTPGDAWTSTPHSPSSSPTSRLRASRVAC